MGGKNSQPEGRRKNISVFVIEDNDVCMRLNCAAVERSPGFHLAARARNGRELFEALSREHADLLLLDLNMPEFNGLLSLRKLRAEASATDVIVISSRKEKEVVRTCFRMGVFAYLIKPCTLAGILETLASYRRYADHVHEAPDELDQEKAAMLLGPASRFGEPPPFMPPKNVSEKTAEHVRCALRLFEASDPADDLAPLANISKSTARRYLEFLTARGAAVRDVEYRPTGRPSHRYRIVE